MTSTTTMNKVCTLISFTLLVLSSCKKEEDAAVNPSLNWKIGATIYSGTEVKDSIARSLYAFAPNSVFIINYFDSLKAGNYNMAYLPDSVFEMGITVATTIEGITYYYSTGSSNIHPIVSLDTANRKVVQIPEMWAYNTFNHKDSVTISGTITK